MWDEGSETRGRGMRMQDGGRRNEEEGGKAEILGMGMKDE